VRSGGKWPKSWVRSLRALTAALSCAVPNMQPHEHDAIGCFTATQVEEL
jgi:hypothetical protein